ncbi:hypothetical protein ACIRD8_10605 [Streptomyces sp. NPDC102451]|uniref:hypothetical protein n=1 Tax=Streptomyces sp. NPDC102451 TaxID=3366177 RepID=UPI00380B5B8B
MRYFLAALLLGVLTLLGGAPAAAGAALPAPLPGAAHAATGPALPDTGAARAAAGPAHLAARASLPEATVRSAPVRWSEEDRAAVSGPGPRAGADRPHGPHHVPPPGHGALPPRPQSLPLPRGATPGGGRAAPFAVVRAGAALPGVRGPPGVTAGQPALRRSCSTDPSPRPPS